MSDLVVIVGPRRRRRRVVAECTCPVCGEIFGAKQKGATYCSNRCRMRAARAREAGRAS